MGRIFYTFSLFIIAFGALTFRRNIAGVIQENSSGIFVLGFGLVDKQFSSLCQLEKPRYYPVLVSCVEYAMDHNPRLGHEIIEKVGRILFPERGPLLDVYESRLFWVEENYAASCAALQPTVNQREMTRLAEMAFSQEKWDALSVYLNCIGDIDNFHTGVSPHKIAELSYQMGKYYESNLQESEALEAYLNAARWYPTVWADPVLAAAVIMETNGTRPRAIQMVSDYFSRAQLPWSVFYLGRKLGDYKFEDRDWIGAYCAYLRANLAGSESPASQVPDRIKEEILAKVSMLENNYGFNPTQCGSGYTTP